MGETLSNNFFKKSFVVISVLMSLFHVTVFTIISLKSGVLYSYHLLFGLVLIFLTSLIKNKDYVSFWEILLNMVFIIFSFCVTVYIIRDYDIFAMRIQVFPNKMDILMGIIATVVVLEATRRATGNALPIIAIISILYALYGYHLPGVFGHRGYNINRISATIYSEQGIFGTPIGVSATNVFLFVLFASFLAASGADKIFQNLSLALAGNKKGGPAKIAVISSTLFGSISGSAVANVVSTGAFTIPMMKKQGYRSSFAGAVEAVASTGGQIMPPIMGAAAFILSDLAGVKYSTVCISAVVPALLYYFTLFIMVDIEATRENKPPLADNQIPSLRAVLKKSTKLIIPILTLLYLLIINQSTPMFAAILSICAIICCSFFDLENRFSLKMLKDGCVGGAKSSLQVIAACATSGIVVGMLSLTGLGLKLSNIIINFSHGNIIATLILAMIVSSVLGMGLPTTAAYIIAATSVTPALIKLGIPPLSAHLFVLYYSAISAITPPVAVASYAAAALAEENSMKVSIEAVRLGLVAFIIPFAFVLNPHILLSNFNVFTIITLIFLIVSSFSLAASIQGWLINKLNIFERIILFIVSLVLMSTNMLLAGISLIIYIGIYMWKKNRVKAHVD